LKQLKDKDTDTRRKAVKDLGEAGKDAQSAAPALVAAPKDNDLFVRRFAAQALGDLEADPKVAAKPLADVRKTPKGKEEGQTAALDALNALGGGKDLKKNKTLGDAIKKAIREIEMRKYPAFSREPRERCPQRSRGSRLNISLFLSRRPPYSESVAPPALRGT